MEAELRSRTASVHRVTNKLLYYSKNITGFVKSILISKVHGMSTERIVTGMRNVLLFLRGYCSYLRLFIHQVQITNYKNWVLLETLRVSQLAIKNRLLWDQKIYYCAESTIVYQRTMPLIRLIQSPPLYNVCLGSVLILFSHLCLCLPRVSFPLDFRTKLFYEFLMFHATCLPKIIPF